MNLQQHYDRYTPEDFDVWRILFERQMKRLPAAASAEYQESLKRIGFTADRIPHFDEVKQRLADFTGWSLAVVPGIVPNEIFFNLLLNKQFPATTWLRKMSQLDYLEEPDMFHDVFGHVPLLTNTAYTDFLQAVSRIALKHLDSELAIEVLGRVYWFTVEFGLIRENGQLRIYGAGILSSGGETEYSLSDVPRHLPFDIEEIMRSPYRKDVFQEKYFVIDSYEQLYLSVSTIEQVLDKMLQEEALEAKSE